MVCASVTNFVSRTMTVSSCLSSALFPWYAWSICSRPAKDSAPPKNQNSGAPEAAIVPT